MVLESLAADRCVTDSLQCSRLLTFLTSTTIPLNHYIHLESLTSSKLLRHVVYTRPLWCHNRHWWQWNVQVSSKHTLQKRTNRGFFSCSKQRANYAAILMSKGVLDIELVMDKLRLKFWLQGGGEGRQWKTTGVATRPVAWLSLSVGDFQQQLFDKLGTKSHPGSPCVCILLLADSKLFSWSSDPSPLPNLRLPATACGAACRPKATRLVSLACDRGRKWTQTSEREEVRPWLEFVSRGLKSVAVLVAW